MNQPRKNILIVCEGQSTEPNYFNEFRNSLIKKRSKVNITIRPKPKQEKNEEEFALRPGAKKRQLRQPEKDLPLSEIGEEYKAQPTCYVREAQLGLDDFTYDEVWAVFDKDGHPNHKEAFELAQRSICGKYVNIAFSSIAFEFWILLHFENSNTAFEKSMCRKNLPRGKKEFFFCGNNTHKSDCKGEKCVCGKLVSQRYLNYEDSRKQFNFSSYQNSFSIAIERAVDLKNSYLSTTRPVYELNPYTNIFRLVFKLKHLPNIDFQWFEFDNPQSFDAMVFQFSLLDNTLNIDIETLGGGTAILKDDHIWIFDARGNMKKAYKREIINQRSIISIELLSDDNNKPIFIALKTSEIDFNITEIPYNA